MELQQLKKMSDSGYPGSDASEQNITMDNYNPPSTPIMKHANNSSWVQTPPPPLPNTEPPGEKNVFHRTPTPRRPLPAGMCFSSIAIGASPYDTNKQERASASPVSLLPTYMRRAYDGCMKTPPPRNNKRTPSKDFLTSPSLPQTSTPTKPKTPTRNLTQDFDESFNSMTSATFSQLDGSFTSTANSTISTSLRNGGEHFDLDTTPYIEGWDTMDGSMMASANFSHVSLNSTLNASSNDYDLRNESNKLPMGYGGWSPQKCAKLPKLNENNEERKEAQINAYIAWVNAQLKKRPGTRLIEDLKCDMQDGVALAVLIEIVGGEPLDGVSYSPASTGEMVSNIEAVILFMTRRRIRMHHTTAKDIVDGNLKSIMRLILALAAHFKPNSVKQSSQSRTNTPSKHEQSVAGLAQTAVAALADARRDAENTMCKPKRPRQLAREERATRGRVGSSTGSDSDHSHRDVRSRHLDGASSCESPAHSQASPRSSGAGSPQLQRKLDFGMGKSRSQDFDPRRPGLDVSVEKVRKLEQEKKVVLDVLKDDHEVLTDDMVQTKRMLLQLQDMLLSGCPPDGAESSGPVVAEACNSGEEVVILRAKLNQTEAVCQDLREDLSKAKNESLQFQGVKAGLQQRLSEQEKSFLAMKAELLRAGFCQQSLENTKADLEQKLAEKDKLVLDLRRELARKDRELDELQTTFQIYQQDKENAARNLRATITDLHEKMKRVGETEAGLSARVANQDKMMAKLEGKILHTNYDTQSRPSSARSIQSTGSDDFQLVRESLRNLRGRFQGDDPHHNTIDTLEQSISSLMDRLQVSEASLASRLSETSRRINYDSTGDVRRSPITALQGFPVQRLDSSTANGHHMTKVLYFTDRTVTPFMCTIPKRLGEISLRDIKNLFGQTGNYRYHFKAMDPEFGTVKEEIAHDDDVVPGWEGKIVAWIEEDHG